VNRLTRPSRKTFAPIRPLRDRRPTAAAGMFRTDVYTSTQAKAEPRGAG
jgi:hypothetical protein